MDIVGNDKVIVRAGTAAYPVRFSFSACTAVDVNDGSLPFGTTIASVAVQVYDSAGADVTAGASATATVVNGLTVDLRCSYPASAAKGRCKVLVQLTLSSGVVITKRWDGVSVE